jgi:transcriptional regulator
MILTRQERERLVLDLYNQGKTVSEISQEVRMSFSGIGAILKKAEQENETSKETITDVASEDSKSSSSSSLPFLPPPSDEEQQKSYEIKSDNS